MNAQNSKIALVTGVSRGNGIGAAVARELASIGMDVFITYFRPYDIEVGLASNTDDPRNVLLEIEKMGRKAAGLEVDLSQADASQQLFDHIEVTFGPVSVLINNAAYSKPGDIEHIDAQQLDKHYAVNVRAMVLLCSEFVTRYKTRSSQVADGRIVNLTSGQSVGPMPEELAYATTKGAVEAFTVSLSADVAALGITVNAVDPGATDTGWMSTEIKAELKAKSPMGRVGTPEDAARLIGFLVSKDAEWITGQIHQSRGGL